MTSAARQFRRPPTAQEAVLAELRRAILERELAPGAQILQDRIAEQLGVSRVPVREALKMLEGEGQVSYAPHRGYFVTELDAAELMEVYQIRDLLEAEAVTRALPHLTDDDYERMQEAVADMEAAEDDEDIIALTAANRRFHFAIMEPCGMPRLIRIIRQLWDSTDPYRSVYFGHAQHRKTVRQEHRGILRAVRERSAEQLVRELTEHRRHAVQSLRAIIDGSATDDVVGTSQPMTGT
jgi:DNA-binding GntR family transcriptional regulator